MATIKIAVERRTASMHRLAQLFLIAARLVNRGHLSHDFKIAGKKSAAIASGKHGLLRVTFRKAGRNRFLCTLPGHAGAGMNGVSR